MVVSSNFRRARPTLLRTVCVKIRPTHHIHRQYFLRECVLATGSSTDERNRETNFSNDFQSAQSAINTNKFEQFGGLLVMIQWQSRPLRIITV